MLKGKLMTTQETLTQVESENKANRETIQRLVNELNKFEKDSVQNKLTFESIKAVIIFILIRFKLPSHLNICI